MPGRRCRPRRRWHEREVLIEDYVRAGFRKIHLDCSMACADDPPPLCDETIAARAARLCAVAEQAHARAGGDPPVYVIGTEVPCARWGRGRAWSTVAVTTPEAARATIDRHRKIFAENGLADRLAARDRRRRPARRRIRSSQGRCLRAAQRRVR